MAADVDLYDMLRERAPSLVVDVNRALAIAMHRGANVGLDELDAIPERDVLARYPYALAAYADLHASLGNIEGARGYLERALEHQSSPAQHALLRRKHAALQLPTRPTFADGVHDNTANMGARLESYWTRAQQSLKAAAEASQPGTD